MNIQKIREKLANGKIVFKEKARPFLDKVGIAGLVMIGVIVLFAMGVGVGFFSNKGSSFNEKDLIALTAVNQDLKAKLSEMEQKGGEWLANSEEERKAQTALVEGLQKRVNDLDLELKTQIKSSQDSLTARLKAESELEQLKRSLANQQMIAVNAETERVVKDNPLMEPRASKVEESDTAPPAKSSLAIVTPKCSDAPGTQIPEAKVPAAVTLAKPESGEVEASVTKTIEKSVASSKGEPTVEEDEHRKLMSEVDRASANWKGKDQFEVPDQQALLERLMDRYIVDEEGWKFPLMENDYGFPSPIKGGSAPAFLADKSAKWKLGTVQLDNPNGDGFYISRNAWCVKGELKKKSTIKVVTLEAPPMKLVKKVKP